MPRSLLSAAVLLVSALGLSGAFVRFRPCGTCDGLALAAQPPIRVDCPDCGDTGKMTLFRSWRPRVPKPVAAVVRAFRDTKGKSGVLALETLARADGTEPGWFSLGICGKYPKARPRFIESDGKRYLIVVMTDPAYTYDHPTATIILLSLRGEFHDRVDFLCGASSRLNLDGIVLDAPPADGARITINPVAGTAEPYTVYRIYQWQQVVRQGFLQQTQESEFKSLCRLGLRADRLEVLTPHRN